ncbi:hypothetical protein V2J09_019792 [Rumex salicifolius]
MKKEQENKRERSRKENLDRAIEHESNGNSAAAYECYQKAVDISPAIAFQLIQVLRKENVDYIVAPYEADAQMTFLAINKHVEAVITEDSDLIPFGCPRIIFKMDKYGQGVEFQYSTLQNNREISFAGFTKQMVLEMCILSGCDYLQSLPGMGLKKAHALVRKFKFIDKHLVKDIAKGEVDPITKLRFEEKNVSVVPPGLTSLEAKRNFRAPRASPKPPKATSPCLRREVADDGTTCERNSSPISLFDLVSSADSESPKQNMSRKLQHSTEGNCASNAVSETSRLGHREITTGSSHLHQKYEENETKEPILRSSYFKTVDKNAPDHISGKVVVRSSYFRKNLTSVNDVNKENNNTIHKSGGSCENNIPGSSSGDSDYCRSLHNKRKASELKFTELEEQSEKKIITEASIPDESNSPSGFTAVKICKGKLGCDISHLDRYSEISEKSLHNFASVISSFQFNSSGSRASGLRAPLRDVRNIVSNR